MNKYSPGPWIVVQSDHPNVFEVETKDFLLAAGIYNFHDATLVAAAPELLEVMVATSDLLRAMQHFSYQSDSNAIDRLLRRVQAACSKATGAE